MKKIIVIMVCGLLFADVAMADIYNTSIYSGQSTMYQGSYSGGSSYSGSVSSRRSSFSGRSLSSGGAYSRFASSLGGGSSSSSSSGGFGSSFSVSTVFGGGSSSYGSSGSSSGSSSSFGEILSELLSDKDGSDGVSGLSNAGKNALLDQTPSNKEYDVSPIGDAVVPLLLLISLLTYLKWRKMR